ncbi:MAG: tetratricopeptide repeat protein [Leptolyngbyaceae cyanobacterium bins.349]|nr:tetratricopeptide repeat protein [Leptolyngbyaceae cyanobacterium bins.349]
MNHPSRCPKQKLTATLLSLSLIVASVSSPASDATPVVSAPQETKLLNQQSQHAQVPAATVAQPRLKLEGMLDEKSNAVENGRRYNIHTFEGKAGEKLTLEVSSQEFELISFVSGVDRKPIASDGTIRSTREMRVLVTLSATGSYTVIVASVKPKETGRYQLQVRETTADDVALAEAERLNQQAWQLYQQGKYAEAVPLVERALAIRKRILGERHPDVALSLNNLASLYSAQGRYSEAEPLDRRSLQIRETQLGKDHSDIANSLNNLALLYWNQGRYSEAEPLFRRSLQILETRLGKDHPTVATSLNNLALLYRTQGRYSEAEPLYRRSLQIWETQLGKDHPNVADSLSNLAGLYQDQGRYSEAEPLFRRSLQIRETRLGKDHPNVATSLSGLALLYRAQGRYSEAEPLFRRSLQIRETRLGKDHPNVADSLNNLALLYNDQGRYSEAEPLFGRSLQIREIQLGKDHPDVATSLSNLAGLYRNQGRYGEAEPLFGRSLQIRETRLGKDHPNVATSLNNLAALYRTQGRYSEAEPLYRRSLQILETRLGKDHPTVATSLNNLALLYRTQGRYSEAEPLYRRSLQIRETQLGKDHPDVATNLSNLALLYDTQERYSEAEPLYRRSLQIRETQLGKDHPDVATSLNNLARLYQSQGNVEQSVAFLKKGMQIEERNLGINLVIGSEQQKRDYIATISGTTDRAISLNLQVAPTNSDATRLALTTLLQRKGRILDALSDNLNRLRQNLTPADQQKLDQLTATRTQLATLYYGGLGTRTPEQYRTEINTLQQQVTRLEADLNNRSAEFRSEAQPITLEAVQAQIPADAVLVELIRYEPYNPAAKPDERWGKPRYAAYTLTASGTIQAVDLGDAAPIDQLADDFRQALRTRESSVKPIARKLDAVLMQPIRQKLGNTRTLLISPDSQLNLIPFAALVDEQNRYLVETYSINYLTSGRDLLRLQTPIASRQPPVLIANPDYANPGNPTSAGKGGFSDAIVATTANSSVKPAPTVIRDRGTNQRSTDLTRLIFGPLPGTAAEAAAIAPKLPNVTLLTGTDATENALKQVQSPKILHIATHGFFLEDVPLVASGSRGGGSLVRNDINITVDPSFRPPTRPGNTENALLRSGLALAGFNPRQSGTEDGVLTALEAAGLNLRGTQLVVLSACETGIGDVANGEGVYGLRRAFVMAGAESQLISLWKVDDTGTKDLMVKYYDKLLAKTGRSDALRQIQLEFLNHPNYRHPYYWAAFIPSGEWKPISY